MDRNDPNRPPHERVESALRALADTLGEYFDVTYELPEPTSPDSEFRIIVRVCGRTEPKSQERVRYLSHEQVRGLRLDRRSDIFSVGAVLYELLAGAPAFGGERTTFGTLERIRTATYRPLRDVNPNVSSELERVVHTALEKEPGRRHETAAALRDELMRLLSARVERGELAELVRSLVVADARPLGASMNLRPIPFGRFLLRERLGGDRVMDVFRADVEVPSEDSPRTIILRRIVAPTPTSDAFLCALIDGAKVAVQITHPNIVHIVEIGSVDGTHYIAYEDVGGLDLATIIDRRLAIGKPMNVAIACTIIASICEALDYAHRATGRDGQPLGFVHRDVRPSNILVTTDGDVRLLTLGIHKALCMA